MARDAEIDRRISTSDEQYLEQKRHKEVWAREAIWEGRDGEIHFSGIDSMCFWVGGILTEK